MQELKGKVAVITGAGSGFGRELAKLCASEGMKLMLVDVDSKGLAATVDLLGDATAITQLCDVSKAEQVQAVADKTYDEFGAAHLLFNNAGVASAGPIWKTTAADWEWVMGVNLMGVVHGIQSFVPRMLAQGEPAHIVNTASLAGLTSVAGSSVYCVSKHGVVTLSECLHQELEETGADIGVSVLCPAFVATGIGHSERNRPQNLADTNPDAGQYAEAVRAAIAAGKLSAEDVARITMNAVKNDLFYVLPHKAARFSVEARMQGIINNVPPKNPMRG